MARRATKKPTVRKSISTPASVLSNEELAFVFNLLNSDDVKVTGRNARPLEVIKQKIIVHLQPDRVAPKVKEDNGDSANTAE